MAVLREHGRVPFEGYSRGSGRPGPVDGKVLKGWGRTGEEKASPGDQVSFNLPKRFERLRCRATWMDPHHLHTILVHAGVMKVAEKAVRQSLSLPAQLAKQVGSMAKSRKLSNNRMLLVLIENGIDAEKRKQEQFFALAERFRNEQDPEAADRQGDELGKMVFGG